MLPECSIAQRVIAELKKRNWCLVCAESCTAGRVSAALASIPGASQVHCGGFVVYRNASKTNWLDVPEDLLTDPRFGSVSPAASRSIAAGALRQTREAKLAIGITGDVGPDAPEETDGTCFICLAEKIDDKDTTVESSKSIKLDSAQPQNAEDISARVERLNEATIAALRFLEDYLTESK